jgi:hypothetical protein
MNPPVSDFDDEFETDYLGSQPLDAALADRFAFIIVTPDWDDLAEEERRAVVTGSGQPIDPAAARQLRQLVEAGRGLVDAVTDEMLVRLAHYVQLVNDLLRTAAKRGRKASGRADGNRVDDDDAQITLSPRRAAMIARNIIAVHVAAMVLEDNPEIGDSALLALRHSIPQRAQGLPVSSMKLAAAHREAWKLAELPSLDPQRFLAMEADPVRRAQVASQLGRWPTCSWRVGHRQWPGRPHGRRHRRAVCRTDGPGRRVAGGRPAGPWPRHSTLPVEVHEETIGAVEEKRCRHAVSDQPADGVVRPG